MTPSINPTEQPTQGTPPTQKRKTTRQPPTKTTHRPAPPQPSGNLYGSYKTVIAAPGNIQTLTKDEWEAEANALFGPDWMTWRFRCPMCGHIATPQDWKDAGAKEGSVGFACVGRWLGTNVRALASSESVMGKGPCDYTGGGLIGLNPVHIEDTYLFAFAPPDPEMPHQPAALAFPADTAEVGY